EVRIDWSGLARRAHRLTVPGTTIAGLTPAPEGASVALSVSTGGGRGAPAGAPDANHGHYLLRVESGQQTRVPAAPPVDASSGGGRGAAPGGGPAAGPGFVFA